MERRPVTRYGLAILAVVASLGLSALLWPVTRTLPGLFFFPAVMFVALYAGLGPALLATALSTVIIAIFLLPPYNSIKVAPIDALRLVVFAVAAVVVTSITAARHRAETALRHLTQDLERRIAERTAQLETTHRAMEASQRLEAIGHLAGGIAHDFSNLLTVVIGNTEVLADTHGPESPDRQAIDEIRRAAERGASLTRQLLAYARRQPLRLEQVSLNEVVASTLPLIRHLSPDTVQVDTNLAPDLPLVMADRSQLEQVLMNICLNACDAMPDGGRLSIETTSPGPYVNIDVQDTGVGMDEETARHALEPFFTTKPVGQGTGLGLSTAYGIVKQLHGDLRLHSAPRAGTRVTVLLPAAG